MISVFRKKCGSSASFQADTKLSRFSVCGNET